MFLFDSRDERCKKPFGAVGCATGVRFCLRCEQGEDVAKAVLHAHAEFSGRDRDTELLSASDGGCPIFSGIYTAPSEPDLVWYSFSVTFADGTEKQLGRQGLCDNDETPEPWQLTVYDATAETPMWFGRGVTYQIFPDRFFRAKQRSVEGLVGQRSLHERWDEPMDYLPNERGDYCADFYGGDLAGIGKKLDYLVSLGVGTIYLNPIFEASTNHRYDTADYRHVDPLLGTENDLKRLCAAAEKRGIRVILDGVFNHTGAKSRYFNRDGFYPTVGAYQSKESPYADWYRFSDFPEEYDAWWGIKNLPAVEESAESYVNFIIRDEDSVVRHWLRAGASGWRLDVADELPDWFIAEIRSAMEQEKGDSFLLGEVWEDGTTKVAYSERRRYLLGRETHGLMNYPFRNAVLDYLRGGRAEEFKEAMETLREHYPRPAYYSAMNFLSTHDTPRLLTVLGIAGDAPADKGDRSRFRLSEQEFATGMARLKLAALVMFCFPGSPTVYYGDEAGMQGLEDPFNRATYPWGHEDKALVAYFARLGALRNARESLQSGKIAYLCADGPVLAFERSAGAERTICVCNAGAEAAALSLPWAEASAKDALTGRTFEAADGMLTLPLVPHEGMMLV